VECSAGHANAEDAHFCNMCGAPLDDAARDQRPRRGAPRWPALVAVALAAGGATAAIVLLLQQPRNESGGNGEVPTETSATTEDRLLPAAFETCDADDVTKVIALVDEGHTVIVDTRSEYGAVQPVECLFAMLGTSSAVQAQVGSTTSMMGSREAVEGVFTYRWSYHPDTGLNMVITEAGS